MKKYLTVGYAYPVYFLLILGQYFLAEGLDSLAGVPVVAQPAQYPPVAPIPIPGSDRAARTAFADSGEAYAKGR